MLRWLKHLLSRRKPLTLDEAMDAAAIRSAIIGYLREHRDWYASWSGWYSAAWSSLTLLVVVLGALTSILTAVNDDSVPQWLLITLPAVSSLCAALLVQFRLRDVCRIRELGRIAAEELICQAFAIRTDDKEAAMKQAIRLRRAAHRLEREQLQLFMAEAQAPLASTNDSQPRSGPNS